MTQKFIKEFVNNKYYSLTDVLKKKLVETRMPYVEFYKKDEPSKKYMTFDVVKYTAIITGNFENFSEGSVFSLLGALDGEFSNLSTSFLEVVQPGDLVMLEDKRTILLAMKQEGIEGLMFTSQDELLYSMDYDSEGKCHSEPDIIAVKRPAIPCSTISNSEWRDAITVWEAECKAKTCFIGLSNEAYSGDLTSLLYRMNNDVYENVLYDSALSLSDNESRMKSCDRHIIIPPINFTSKPIVGQGLYNQWRTRIKAGKKLEIYVNDSISTVKEMLKIENGSNADYAVVIIE